MSFLSRHIGPDADDLATMLRAVGAESLDQLIDRAVPESIRFRDTLALPEPLDEPEALAALRRVAARNTVMRQLIGQGYHETVTPAAIRRNILENPGFYTSYTPYQPEISQGRLELLLTFQNAVIDLTGMDVANASLLDESSAVALSLIHISEPTRPY